MSTNAQINNTTKTSLGHIQNTFNTLNGIKRRIIIGLRKNTKNTQRKEAIRTGYKMETPTDTSYAATYKAMISFERVYTGENATAIHEKMLAFANNARFGYKQRLSNEADIWLKRTQNEIDFSSAMYLKNYGEKRVAFRPSIEFYTFCLTSNKSKTNKKYILHYREHELQALHNGIGEMYKPDMWGKETDIAIESPSEWVYFLKAKAAFKVRKPALLETMRQDLRIYLNQKSIDITSKATYKAFISAIVNAYIPNQIDMYAHDMLGSKHIMSGVNKYNEALAGDMERKYNWPKSRTLNAQATTII